MNEMIQDIKRAAKLITAIADTLGDDPEESLFADFFVEKSKCRMYGDEQRLDSIRFHSNRLAAISGYILAHKGE